MLVIYKTETELLLGWSNNERNPVKTRVDLSDTDLIARLTTLASIPATEVYNKFIHIKLSALGTDKDALSKKLSIIETILNDEFDYSMYQVYLSGEIFVDIPIYKSTDLKNPIATVDYKTPLYKDKLDYVYYSTDNTTCYKCNMRGNCIIVSTHGEDFSKITLLPLSKFIKGTVYDDIKTFVASI